MQKGFLGSGEGGGNHKKKGGSYKEKQGSAAIGSYKDNNHGNEATISTRNGRQDVNMGQCSSIATLHENGFFLEKWMAYPVISNYVRNTLGKYGVVKSMLNSYTRLFVFQFSSMDCLDSMLENGLWFIRNNPLIWKKWNPDVNLLKEDVGNVLVWVKLHVILVTAFSEDGLSVIATKLGTSLMLDSYTSNMYTQSWGRSSYARAMIELQADLELKDTIMVAMPKLVGERFYTCTIRVEYEWKPLSQAPRGVPVGPKVGFKPVKQVCRPVSKNNNANTSGNKKKDAKSRKEVTPNPFDVVNSVENDVDLGTYTGTSNLASKEANYSGSSFWNVGSSSTSTTPTVVIMIVGMKFNQLIMKWQVFLASKRDGYGTNSLLEQWRKTYENADYAYEKYDDDMYEDKKIPDNIQSICDKLDIKVQGR
ncbi:reverse transcriptase domain-containing protein [Tanacetum coccineum]|uniref:Reverse transcriptase domain-containing protein n=1 Tax=Tanacetum coccineum TaxID=301880 RepID=A0ABQ4Y2U8_9ASTR